MFPQNQEKILVVSTQNIPIFRHKLRQAYVDLIKKRIHLQFAKQEQDFKEYFCEQFIKQMIQYKEEQTSREKTQTMQLLPDLISQQFQKFFVSGSHLEKPITEGIRRQKSKRGRPLKYKQAEQGLTQWIQSQNRTYFSQQQLQIVFNDQLALRQKTTETFTYKKTTIKYLIKILTRNNIKGIVITSRDNHQYSLQEEQKSQNEIFDQSVSEQLRWFQTPVYYPQYNDEPLCKLQQQ